MGEGVAVGATTDRELEIGMGVGSTAVFGGIKVDDVLTISELKQRKQRVFIPSRYNFVECTFDTIPRCVRIDAASITAVLLQWVR